MSAHAAPSRLHGLGTALRWPGAGRAIARTAGFNAAATAAAGLGGILLARTLGPAVRGEYAAITAWFGVTLMAGGMGQPAAVCYFVARDPLRGRQYAATSRAMMLVTGTLALVAGIVAAPALARGNAAVADGYRIAFAISIVAFVGASYTFSLQALDLSRWNLVRVIQPALSLAGLVLLWSLGALTLRNALAVLAVTMVVQLGAAYRYCRMSGLAPGHMDAALIRPLAGYGMAQFAALTPAALNAQLDQLVLSQTVPPADLGRYAIAVSLALLPMPLVAAIGNVAFPRLAASRVVTDGTRRLQLIAVLASAALSAGIIAPIAALAHWLVPMVFGAGYRGAVPLLWLLAPGAVFLACGQVVGDLLRGRSHPGVVAWAESLAAVFTIVLLLALLPVVGVAGAAIASTIAYGIALAVMLRSLWRLPRHARGSGDAMPPRDRAAMEPQAIS